MNKLSLKRIHLEHLHVRKCLWDNITEEDTPIFSGKSEGLSGSLQDLYTATYVLRISRRKKRFLCRCRTMIIAGVCYRLLNLVRPL